MIESIKNPIQIMLTTLRIIISLTALWLIIEYIYFSISGNYIIYYLYLRKAADSFPEVMHVVYNVFVIQHNVIANVFSNYFVPISGLLSLVLVSIDIIIHFKTDLRFNYCYNFRHEIIVVFPIYAEEILLQMVEPTDLIFVGHEYWDNASEYYPTIELTRDIPGRLYTNMDLHDLFASDRKPTLIIVDDYLQLAYEHQYGDIPEIVNGQVRTVYVKPPKSIKDITDLFQQLGEAVHAEGQAEKMTVEFMAEYDQICKAFSKLDLKQPVTAMYYEHIQDSFPLLSEICGLINMYEGMDWVNDERFQEASVLNPDIIFYCPVEFDSDGSILSISQKYSSMCREIIIQEPFLQDTNAVQNDRIYPLFFHQSQYILDDAWYVLSLLKSAET